MQELHRPDIDKVEGFRELRLTETGSSINRCRELRNYVNL